MSERAIICSSLVDGGVAKALWSRIERGMSVISNGLLDFVADDEQKRRGDEDYYWLYENQYR
jgi:hypothetical protein